MKKRGAGGMGSISFALTRKKKRSSRPVEIPYEPEPFQADIHASTAKNNALLGSPGLGKTILGANETARHIRSRLGNGLILFPTYGMAYQIGLRELAKWIPDGIRLPRSPQTNYIELPNGRVIFIRSAEHPEAIDGCDGVSFVWIDEGDLINVDSFRRCNERLNRQRPGIHEKSRLVVTLTPTLVGGESWTKDILWQKYMDGDPEYYCRRATIWESRRISEDLKQEVARDAPPGSWARARYDAEWAIIGEGLIYPELPKLGTNYTLRDCSKFILGIDAGYRDPFVCILIGKCGDNWILFDEVRSIGYNETVIANEIDAMLTRNGINFAINAYHDHDPNQIGNVAARVRSKINWYNAEKEDRDASIGYMRDLMILKRMHFDVRVAATYNEYAGYRWKIGGVKQEPEHKYSHGPDGSRYGIWSDVLSSQTGTKFIYNRRK